MKIPTKKVEHPFKCTELSLKRKEGIEVSESSFNFIFCLV